MIGYREDDGTAGTDIVVRTGGTGLPREADGGGVCWRRDRSWAGGKGQGWGRGKRKSWVG